MTQERWKKIEKFKSYIFNGKYEVSTWGNIRNVQTKKSLATYSSQRGNGYLKTKIYDTKGKRRALYIHQLVAFYFLNEKPDDFLEVDHIDGNSLNNSFTNLRYLTHADNVKVYHEARKLQENE